MTPTAALIAAFATALAALSGFVIAKDLKVTEVRQAWIDAQRTDLALAFAEAYAISVAIAGAIGPGGKPTKPKLKKFDEALLRVKLRENPERRLLRTEWREVIEAMSRLRGDLARGACMPGQVRQAEDMVIDHAQKLLKIEWDRVRSGEASVRSVRRCLFALVVGGVFALSVWGGAQAYGQKFVVIHWHGPN